MKGRKNEINTSIELIKETLIHKHCFKLDPALLEEKQKEELRGPYTS